MVLGLVVTSCFALFVFLFSDWILRTRKLLKLPKLPFPFYPLLGHALSITTDQNQFFHDVVENCHKHVTNTGHKTATIWFGMLGNTFCLHPDAAKLVLGNPTKHLSKNSNYQLVTPWIKEGLVTSAGSKWHSRRKMITPSFHYDILKDFLHVMNEHAGTFVDTIKAKVKSGEKVDISKQLKLCTLDIICETAMGSKVDAQTKSDSEYVQCVQRMAKFVHLRLTRPWYRSSFIFNKSSLGRRQRETLEVLHATSREVTERKMSTTRVSELPKRKALIDMLITSKTEDGSSLTVEDIQEEVDTFMFAGHDTTSVALTWIIYMLGRHADVQAKVHAEMDAVFGGDRHCDITPEHIKDLVYTDQVVKEVMRLYPSVPFIGRILDSDMVVDDCVIPKGENVSIFIYFIHRHPQVWDEPEKFDPDRFDPEVRSKKTYSPYAYIPFSAGPRNCIGQRFAQQELKVVMAKFFRDFSVVAHDETVRVNSGLVLECDGILDLDIQERPM